MRQRLIGVGCAVLLAAAAAAQVSAQGAPSGRKDCGELKTEIAKKIEANGVKTYALEIVATEEAAGQESKGYTIVGSCDVGTKKIVYKRG